MRTANNRKAACENFSHAAFLCLSVCPLLPGVSVSPAAGPVFPHRTHSRKPRKPALAGCRSRSSSMVILERERRRSPPCRDPTGHQTAVSWINGFLLVTKFKCAGRQRSLRCPPAHSPSCAALTRCRPNPRAPASGASGRLGTSGAAPDRAAGSTGTLRG